MPLNQKQMRRLLEQEGWTCTRGGKHVVKMEKPGQRPITLPRHGGQAYGIGLERAFLRQAGLRSMAQISFHAQLQEEDGSLWASVDELPGCFASGRDFEELQAALLEAVQVWLPDGIVLGDARVEVEPRRPGSATQQLLVCA